MSGGRLKLDVLAAGAVVPAFQMQDAVHAGILDGGHGVCAYWYGKNKAFSLFGTPPVLRLERQPASSAGSTMAAARRSTTSCVNEILKLNIVGFLYRPDADPAARLVQEAKSTTADDLKGMKYRTVGLAADLFKEMGAAVTILAGRRDRAGAGPRPASTAPSSTIRPPTLLGFPDVSKNLHGPELSPAG